jgi:HEAT repeat protein
MRSQSANGTLENLARNLEADEIVRAHSIIALGKLNAKDFVGWLAKDGLTDRHQQVQRSSAIALGMLTDKEDEKTVDVLIQHADHGGDRAVRNFSLIALGQIGGMKARDFLVSKLKKGQPHDKTFSALALGVYGYACKEAKEKEDIGEQILNQWKEDKTDSSRGAFAIGMGLVDYKKAIPTLLDEMKTGGSPDLKGHTATALGLLGAKDAIPEIQALAKKSSDLDAQRRASIALGLIGDPQAVPLLIELIKESSQNLSALGGAAVALGFIGDRQAITPLNDMLAKRDVYKENARAFAAVALGILGDKSELPLLSKVKQNCNYLASTESLSELLLIY